VGAGQAGLAMAYYLAQGRGDFVALDAGQRVGESWRNRWDSLRLFTPAKFSALPGMPFPAPDFYFPTKDEMAANLVAYAARYQLPIRFQMPVETLTRSGDLYRLRAGAQSLLARQVVVATGAYHRPYIPPFAQALDPAVVQLHSQAYRNPAQIPAGNVLVVGAGNSGAEIAIELAHAGRNVWLSGRDVGHIPANTLGRLFGGRPYWWLISRVLSVATPVGRRVRQKTLAQGAPLIHVNKQAIERAGVKRVPRTTGASNGQPQLDDGQLPEIAAVVWATGFRPDFHWIDLPICDAQGYPLHTRGVVPTAPGLYFLGLPFQSALTSGLIGGVGADARYIADHIANRIASNMGSQRAAGAPYAPASPQRLHSA
jgi:putative flavoprotein involved in K+ transport